MILSGYVCAYQRNIKCWCQSNTFTILWYHDTEIVSALLALHDRNPSVDSPYKRAVMWSFDVFSVLTLQWHHNECNSVSNHQLLDCLLNCLLRRRAKKTLKLRVTGLCEGNPPVTGGFPSQRASNAENVSIWWCHHDNKLFNYRYSNQTATPPRNSSIKTLGFRQILHHICQTVITTKLNLIIKSTKMLTWHKINSK